MKNNESKNLKSILIEKMTEMLDKELAHAKEYNLDTLYRLGLRKFYDDSIKIIEETIPA